MISIKKYLDRDAFALAGDGAESKDLLAVTMEAYRCALRAIGKRAVDACPGPAQELERDLAGLAGRLEAAAAADEVQRIEEGVESALERWGSATAGHLKGKADEVKELLIMLARTAESVGERDQRYTVQFGGLTRELEAIANLDDISQIRLSLVKKATELKSCVDQMAHDGQHPLLPLPPNRSPNERTQCPRHGGRAYGMPP